MKPSNNEPPTNWPRPEEFPPGSLLSKAAARLLAAKRKASGFYIHIHDGRECEHCKRNEHGPNDITITINNVVVSEDESHEAAVPREKARPVAKAAPPIPQQEQIAIDARQDSETKSAASTDTQHDDDEAAREARFKAYMTPRRPLVRPRPRRYRWPPSAYGL